MKATKIMLYAVASLLVIACDNDTTSTQKTEMIKMLTATAWITDNVQHTTDGDLTFQYEDLSLVFIKSGGSGFDGDYIVSNGGNAFIDTFGKWKLGNNLETIELSNGRQLTINELTNQLLVITFFVEEPGGRKQGLSGEFIFTLKH